MARQIKIVQNVPPFTPFKAVKSVNLPPTGVVKPMVVLLIAPPLIATVAAVMVVNLLAAGVVRPMVELLIMLLAMVTLLIDPPVMTVFFTFSVMMLGFINHCSQGMLGRPVVGSRNDEYGMLMLLLGSAVAINYPQQTF
jgi:hypothetical protein